MSVAAGFLQSIGSHLLDCGRVVVDRKPLGENLFHLTENYFKETPLDTIRSGLISLFAVPPDQLPTLIEQCVEHFQLKGEKLHALGAYLDQVPSSLRRMLVEGIEPKRMVDQVVLEGKPDRLAVYLPQRVPRFRTQDQPEGIGGWVLTRMLGQGGFGEVWLARHPDFHSTRAAYKFCIGDDNQQGLLRHEAKVLNQATQGQAHPGVVKLLDANLKCNPPWLKYEYVTGGELGSLIGEWSRLPFPERLAKINQVILELAGIVGYCHLLSPAVIHRDLKPSNILVERSPLGDWKLRVADFGIGNVSVRTVLDRERLMTSLSLNVHVQRAHTPLYASPQQRHSTLDPAPTDDVYAIGVIWYQLLIDDSSARAPIGEWIPEFLKRGFAPEYLELLDACIKDDPSKRPQNAAELAERLKQCHQLVSPRAGITVVKPANPVADLPPTPHEKVQPSIPLVPPAPPKSNADAGRKARELAEQRRRGEVEAQQQFEEHERIRHEAKEQESARLRIEQARRDVEERQRRSELKIKQERESREAEAKLKKEREAREAETKLKQEREAREAEEKRKKEREVREAAESQRQKELEESDFDLRLSLSEEDELRHFFKSALSRNHGQISKADSAAANRIVRDAKIPTERARKIFLECVQEWKDEDEIKLDDSGIQLSSPSNRGISLEADSDEFELTLGAGSDFDLALDEDKIEGSTDLENSDFDLALDEDEIEAEASSEVVLLDDEEEVELKIEVDEEDDEEDEFEGLSAEALRRRLISQMNNIPLRKRYLKMRTFAQKQADRKYLFWRSMRIIHFNTFLLGGTLWAVGFCLGFAVWAITSEVVKLFRGTLEASWDTFSFNTANVIGVLFFIVWIFLIFVFNASRKNAGERLGPIPADVLELNAQTRKKYLGESS